MGRCRSLCWCRAVWTHHKAKAKLLSDRFLWIMVCSHWPTPTKWVCNPIALALVSVSVSGSVNASTHFLSVSVCWCLRRAVWTLHYSDKAYMGLASMILCKVFTLQLQHNNGLNISDGLTLDTCEQTLNTLNCVRVPVLIWVSWIVLGSVMARCPVVVTAVTAAVVTVCYCPTNHSSRDVFYSLTCLPFVRRSGLVPITVSGDWELGLPEGHVLLAGTTGRGACRSE